MSDLRYCICADPENCTETIPGYVCRKVGSPMTPDTPDLRLEEIRRHASENFLDYFDAAWREDIPYLLNQLAEARQQVAQAEAALKSEREQHHAIQAWVKALKEPIV